MRAARADAAKRVSWRDARRLDRRFYVVTAIACVLTLARFSEAFLVLRAQDVGLGTTRCALGDGGDVRRLRR